MTRLSLTMKDFDFFGKDLDDTVNSIEELLHAGHWITFEMTTSTSLTFACYHLDRIARRNEGVEMTYDYQLQEQYSNKPPQMIVYLSPAAKKEEIQ